MVTGTIDDGRCLQKSQEFLYLSRYVKIEALSIVHNVLRQWNSAEKSRNFSPTMFPMPTCSKTLGRKRHMQNKFSPILHAPRTTPEQFEPPSPKGLLHLLSDASFSCVRLLNLNIHVLAPTRGPYATPISGVRFFRFWGIHSLYFRCWIRFIHRLQLVEDHRVLLRMIVMFGWVIWKVHGLYQGRLQLTLDWCFLLEKLKSRAFHLGHPRVTVARQSDWALFALGLNLAKSNSLATRKKGGQSQPLNSPR
jgi:hypothetical protein